MITPTSAYAPGETPPMYSGTWTFETGTPPPQHNFSFTSEVRYWFSYSTSKQYTLNFTGDDDVWVFVNRKLAVDMGVFIPRSRERSCSTRPVAGMSP